MHIQLNLFPGIYEANMRQAEILKQYEKGNFNDENLGYLLYTLDIYMDLKKVPPKFFKWILEAYYDEGFKIDRKYLEYTGVFIKAYSVK